MNDRGTSGQTAILLGETTVSRPWTSKEIARLRRDCELGAAELGRLLGRSVHSVKMAAYRHRSRCAGRANAEAISSARRGKPACLPHTATTGTSQAASSCISSLPSSRSDWLAASQRSRLLSSKRVTYRGASSRVTQRKAAE